MEKLKRNGAKQCEEVACAGVKQEKVAWDRLDKVDLRYDGDKDVLSLSSIIDGGTDTPGLMEFDEVEGSDIVAHLVEASDVQQLGMKMG